ncbi:MAG: stage 0 sporulation family protein [Acidobacteria bacterium]|nr:MAG: stage 0 sporulation family protein [Acidobacteriota bacterium]
MLVAQIRLPGRARPVSCATALADLELDDSVVVELDGGSRLGRVARVPLDLPWPDPGPAARVLRRAGREDEERASHRERRTEKALRVARQRAEELGLDMKFVRAEGNPSGRRLTLFFVAEGRVDFRQLVRDLARQLRARIDLRQIGVRDAAIAQGGIGHCGRQLCCASFLPGFAPVAMKMAKAQGLPLNPSKISGQCGRLMCCLRYELEPGGLPGGSRRGDRTRSGSGCQDCPRGGEPSSPGSPSS